jgi:hypothetical protein
MPTLGPALRATSSRLALLLVGLALIGRARSAIRRRNAAEAARRLAARSTLPSLYDIHPEASATPRRRLGLQAVPVDAIVGTLRRPSQNTADFLPLPQLRGTNWQSRWQRITRATDRLAMLPPIDLVKVGDAYYVADGHNRVAAARVAGMVEIDADVTEVLLPGLAVSPASPSGEVMVDAELLRQAARGRYSRTVEQRAPSDILSRRQLEERLADEAERDEEPGGDRP